MSFKKKASSSTKSVPEQFAQVKMVLCMVTIESTHTRDGSKHSQETPPVLKHAPLISGPGVGSKLQKSPYLRKPARLEGGSNESKHGRTSLDFTSGNCSIACPFQLYSLESKYVMIQCPIMMPPVLHRAKSRIQWSHQHLQDQLLHFHSVFSYVLVEVGLKKHESIF